MSNRIRDRVTLVLALAVVPVLAACKRDRAEEAERVPPATMPSPMTVVRVTDVDLGNAIGLDRRVTAETDDFRPSDTIYAVITTDGSAANAPLTARWIFQDGQTVEESTQTISPTGPAFTEFHISKPSGWPEGKYKVEILLNGASVGTKEFEVKK